MGAFRKIASLTWSLALIVAVVLIDRDPELFSELEAQRKWREWFEKRYYVPVFDQAGRWLVERNFDSRAHWKWQLQEIERLYGPQAVR
jgi:hypothetical protein